MEPGLIGGEINALLARHKQKHGHPIQYKIGPDPSSIDSCMVGGMVANNSSGMCCGVSQNVRPLASISMFYGTLVRAELLQVEDASLPMVHADFVHEEGGIMAWLIKDVWRRHTTPYRT